MVMENNNMRSDLNKLLISPDDTVRKAIERIDLNCKGIVMLVNGEKKLESTITDGDIRRSMLAGFGLDTPISQLVVHKNSLSLGKPITAHVATDTSLLLKIMKEHGIHQLPLTDSEGRLVDLVTMDDILPDRIQPLQAVIMAGGSGTRLMPFTKETPKPMLPIGNRPLMERIISQLRDAGIKNVNVTTHYQPDKISDHFGDGQKYGVDLKYVEEDRPLGTAGSLNRFKSSNQPLLVINGDILTKVNLRAMIMYHNEHNSDMTVAVSQYVVKVPYGVIESDGASVTGVREKPELTVLVNVGIYLIEPSVHNYIPDDEKSDMTDLIKKLLKLGRSVASFPVHEYWLDIGHHDDYKQAQEDVRNGLFEI